MALERLQTISEVTSPYTGKIIKLNFTDKRLPVGILKLYKRFANVDEEYNTKLEEAKLIEDDIDKAIAIASIEPDIIEDFKKSIDETFRTNFVEQWFGEDYLPDIPEYFSVFEALKPYIDEAVSNKEKVVNEINLKYGLNRINTEGLMEA
jgi:hypothetical protein